MRTKNAMQLKAIIRNKAKEQGVPPQLERVRQITSAKRASCFGLEAKAGSFVNEECDRCFTQGVS